MAKSALACSGVGVLPLANTLARGSTMTRIDHDHVSSGLVGGQYIGITPGGDEQYLKQGDRIEFVQDAFVLENLINPLASTFLRRDQGSAEGGNQGGSGRPN